MEEKMDLKTFYYSTLPTEENFARLKKDLPSTIRSKTNFVNLTNQFFAMLAHLEMDSKNFNTQLKKLKFRSTIITIGQNLRSVNDNYELNPTADPIIHRYMKIFEAYEQQNGIENPFTE